MLPAAAICTLVALGDTHGRPAVSRQVVDYVRDNEPTRPSAVLLAGDYASDEDMQQHFRGLLSTLRGVTDHVIATRGNHDDREWFEGLLGELPQFYSVCDGQVGVLVVDSTRTSQIRFVQRKIEENPDRLYIVLMHYPPLTCAIESSQNNGGTRWRNNLETVLRPGDLIIAGHNHVTCEYPLFDGVFVYVTSRSGSKRYTCLSHPPGGDSSCADDSGPAYLRLELEDRVWRRTWVEVP